MTTKSSLNAPLFSLTLAAASFAAKAVGGAGPIIAGFVIDLAGIAPGSSPGEVAAESIARFGWATAGSVLVLSTLSIVCMGYYRITRQQHAEILAEIRLRES